MAKAIIIKCPPQPSFIGNVVEAEFWGTQEQKGKVIEFFRVTPTKRTPAGQEILFSKQALAFLPPESDLSNFDKLTKPTEKTVDA